MDHSACVIAGIGTDVGKTVVSAILAEAHGAAYWKPVQAGDLHQTDSMRVRSYCSEKVTVLAERFLLNTPASPHTAAAIDKISIQLSDLEIHTMDHPKLIIESAGGLLVPLNNDGLLYLDVIREWKLPVVLVSRHYLGSINHTLLSLEMLKQQHVPVRALIFVGSENLATESIILQRFPVPLVHRIPLTENVDADFVRKQAQRIPFQLF
jgi:dethiobiotin synthetase